MLWSFSPSLGQFAGDSRSVSPDPRSPEPPSPWTDPVLPQGVWKDPRLSCILLWIQRNFDRSWLGICCCLHQLRENDLEWKWTFSFLCSTWRGSLPVEDGTVASVAYRKIKKWYNFLEFKLFLSPCALLRITSMQVLFGHVSFKSTMMGWLSFFPSTIGKAQIAYICN